MPGKSQIGIGVIGCGTIAERMVTAWKPNMKGARIAAISDVNLARIDALKAKFPEAKGFEDYRALLADPGVDAVLVLTPNFMHAENTIAAAQAGKHVLCQKPMAMNLDEARRMIDAARANKVTLMASFVQRFWVPFVKARELLEQGAIGQILSVRSQFSHSGIGKYYKPASNWFLDPAKSGGGPLSDLGVHHFDVLRWIVDAEITDVSAEMGALGGAEGQENCAAINLRFANGVLGQGFYAFVTQAPPGVTLQRLEIYGTIGTIMVTLQNPARPTLQLVAESGPAATFGGWIDVPVVETVPAFSPMLQHFVDCIRDGKRPVTTGEDGYRSVEVIQAAYTSAREGRRVTIDLSGTT